MHPDLDPFFLRNHELRFYFVGHVVGRGGRATKSTSGKRTGGGGKLWPVMVLSSESNGSSRYSLRQTYSAFVFPIRFLHLDIKVVICF